MASFVTLHAQNVEEYDDAQDLPYTMTMTEDYLLDEWYTKEYVEEDKSSAQQQVSSEPGSPELYQYRLRRIPAGMDLVYNDVVKRFIEKYTVNQRRTISVMLGLQRFYVPMIEEVLAYYGLPMELRYLPIIESAFNPQATSPVGAAGLWQFMPGTGKHYKLEINSLVDERRDPVKSTWAAAKYLSDMYKIYKDWELVIAAYNCGPGNVNKAINRAGGQRDFWKIYPYLPKETRSYVPAFIAVNYAMTYYCEHGIKAAASKIPEATDTVMVSRNLHVDQLVDLLHVDRAKIKALNPQYRTDVIPGDWKPCALRLPLKAVTNFVALGDSIYKHRAGELLKRRGYVPVNEGGGATSSRRKSGVK